jgi:hypothetical protein
MENRLVFRRPLLDNTMLQEKIFNVFLTSINFDLCHTFLEIINFINFNKKNFVSFLNNVGNKIYMAE